MNPADASRPVPVPHRRRPHALVLSAVLHGCLGLAWLLVPAPVPDSLGAAPLVVELLHEPPPSPPEPEPEPEPEPPPQQPAPAKPEPVAAKPAPAPKPSVASKPNATPRPAPAAPLAATPSPAAQPVSSEPVVAPMAAEPAANTVPVPTPAARGAERDDYLRLVWARIMRFRPERVPFAGTARLRFTLAADGALLAAELAESSGSSRLDRAALDALRQAAPFPPPPPGLADPTFEIPFQFRPA